MKKTWDWVKERLKKEEIKNKILLCTDSQGRNAWQIAGHWDRLDVMKKTWELP